MRFCRFGRTTALVAVVAMVAVQPRLAVAYDDDGMRAIYDAATGGLRFEGVSGVKSIGIAKATSVTLNPGGLHSFGDLSFANDYEAGWIFHGGFQGDAFDAGALLEPGLESRLDQYFIQAATGFGLAPVPIYNNGVVYTSAYTLDEIDAMLYLSTVPPTPDFPIPAPPTVPSPPDLPAAVPPSPGNNFDSPLPDLPAPQPATMGAFYDPVTGNLRFEGMEGVRGVGISRSGSATLRFEAANHVSPHTVAYDKEVGWIFLDGVSGGAFDGGAILPTGLSSELDQYFVQADSWVLPITSGGVAYSSAYATATDVEATWFSSAPAGSTAPSPGVPLAPPPDASGIRAVYDPDTGSVRLEGIGGATQVQVARVGDQPFFTGPANNSIPIARNGLNRVQWTVADAGVTAFDAGRLLPAGLDEELSQYFVQVDSWLVPITSGETSYASAHQTMADVEATWLPGTETYNPFGSFPVEEYPPGAWTPPPVEEPPIDEQPTYVPPVYEPPGDSPPGSDEPSEPPFIEIVGVLPYDPTDGVITFPFQPGIWEIVHLVDYDGGVYVDDVVDWSTSPQILMHAYDGLKPIEGAGTLADADSFTDAVGANSVTQVYYLASTDHGDFVVLRSTVNGDAAVPEPASCTLAVGLALLAAGGSRRMMRG